MIIILNSWSWLLKDLNKVPTSSSPVMQFWSWPLNSCFVILSRAIWPHTLEYEQFCIENYYILYIFLNYSNFRLQWEGYFYVFLLPPDQQGTFSACRSQKEVFPSTWTNDSTWGIYICSCSVYEGWLQQRWWWREYKINNKCYFVSPGSTSSYFSRNSSWRTIFSRI